MTAADKAPHLPAHCQALGVVKLPMDTAVDSALAGLLGGGPEAFEPARHVSQTFGRAAERNLFTEEVAEDCGSRAAECTVAGRVRRERRRCQKRRPGAVRVGVGVA